MLPAEQIQPYINLITWQVVALLGGVIFTPAIYGIVRKMNRFSVLGATAELSNDDARELEDAAEKKIDTRAAASATVTVAKAAEELEEIADAPTEDKEVMYENIVAAHLNVAAIVRSIALPHGGHQSLKRFADNVTLLAHKNLVPREEIPRLQWFHRRRYEFRRDLQKLTRETYRQYINKARRAATRLSEYVPKNDASPQSSIPALSSKPENTLPL